MRKKCGRCQVVKPLTDFNKCKHWKDGYELTCRACRKAKYQQLILDIVDYRNHPIQTKTWIRNLMRTSRRKSTTTELVNQLYNLLLSTPRCRFTNEKLIPGQNIHLDHIIPLSRHGTDTIDNLQWVSPKYNRAKNDMTNTEFIKFANMVVKNVQKLH